MRDTNDDDDDGAGAGAGGMAIASRQTAQHSTQQKRSGCLAPRHSWPVLAVDRGLQACAA